MAGDKEPSTTTAVAYATGMDDGCTCRIVRVGGRPTGSHNWDAQCPEHGTASAWWKSPEQVARRESDSRRLRDLQELARSRRAAQQG
jgi:hypothetical protein